MKPKLEQQLPTRNDDGSVCAAVVEAARGSRGRANPRFAILQAHPADAPRRRRFVWARSCERAACRRDSALPQRQVEDRMIMRPTSIEATATVAIAASG